MRLFSTPFCMCVRYANIWHTYWNLVKSACTPIYLVCSYVVVNNMLCFPISARFLTNHDLGNCNVYYDARKCTLRRVGICVKRQNSWGQWFIKIKSRRISWDIPYCQQQQKMTNMFLLALMFLIAPSGAHLRIGNYALWQNMNGAIIREQKMQKKVTTQRNNHNMREHSHVPRRPC